MDTRKLIYATVAILLGGFFVVYGGIDDSPGGQLLGVVMAIIGIVILVKSWKK